MTSSAEGSTQHVQAQALAADPAVHVFVTANAGSGKTKVLIDRIARLLLLGSPPASFLCITYTKAAAAEMQRRLFERLGAWCVTADEKLALELAALTGQGEVQPDDLARARALFAQALETPGGLKIQTIHAFCERILARFPLEACAPPGFDIADDATARAMIAASWDRMADQSLGSAALDRFGVRLDQGRLEGLLSALVARRVAFGRLVPPDTDVSAAAAALRLQFGPMTTAEDVYGALLARAPWGRLRDAAAVLRGSTANNVKLAELIDKARMSGDAEDYLSVFLTDARTIRANAPTKAIKQDHPFLDALFAEESDRVMEALSAVRAAERGLDTEACITLAGLLNRTYADVKAKRATLDFDDLIQTALALLQDQAAGPWVLYKLDGGINHILIDEGQDTSPEQWSLLAPLQNEFFAGDGARDSVRTVFAVGDPKQSIYSFQGADPERFTEEGRALAVRADAAGALHHAPELTTSFRSTPEVLQAVDATFRTVRLGAGTPEQDNKVFHIANRANAKGAVEWWPVAPRPERMPSAAWDAPRDQEADDSAQARLALEVANTIAGMIQRGEAVEDKNGLRPIHAGDVLILVRSRGRLFSELLRACKRKGLPVAGADRLRLADDLAVQDALTLIRVALDPFDDLSLACLLKGPWLNLTDDNTDLYPLAEGRDKGEALWDRLFANTEPRFEEARRLCSLLRERRSLSAFEFLALALEEPGTDGRSGWVRVFERLGEECADPLQELLNRALGASSRGEAGLQAFLCAVDADEALIKRELEGAGEALRIMTVHGSKGLEAPVVFLPDTTDGPELSPTAGLFLDGSSVALATTGAGEDDPFTKALRARHEERARAEHWRLLYVAMTRARDRVIVCGHGRGRGAGIAEADSWHSLVGQELARIALPFDTPFGPGWRLGQPVFAARSAKAQAFVPPVPSWAQTPATLGASHAVLRPSLAYQGAALSPRAGAARFRRGTLIHGLLQRLPEVEPAQRAVAGHSWLLRQGVDEGDVGALLTEALGVIEDAGFAAAFGTNSRAEAPVIGHFQGRRVRGVIDRLVVTDAEALAIDFKTDRPPPALAEEAPLGYLTQMALYREVLRTALPGRTVRCAFVWTFAPCLTPIPEAVMDDALAQAVFD